MKRLQVLIMIVLLTGLSSLSTVRGKVQYLDFVLEEKPFTRLCKNKSMLVVNGGFPGPAIRVQRGDTVFVTVHNYGNYGVTIHWHGVMQPRNPWSDGPEYITQCPIQPRTNFTYEINFTTEEGTVWWHAHSDWTRSSVHGVIIVYPAEGSTYPFPEPDGEEIIVLGSWYIDDINKVVDIDLAEGTALPASDAYTINGQPGDFLACSKDSTYHWYVDYGKTYHVRFLNADMNAELFLSIADHDLTIVGMDGLYVKPFVTSYILIAPGQTIDALLTVNQSLGTYYIVTRQLYSSFPGFDSSDKTNASAILEYKGNYSLPNNPAYPTTLPMYLDLGAAIAFTKKFRSLADNDHPIDVPMNISTKMFITGSIKNVWEPSYRYVTSMNNITWINPAVDVLQAYYRNISGWYTTDFPNDPPTYFDFTADNLPINTTIPTDGTKVKVLNYSEEVEIVFQGTNVLHAATRHPMHLHGYTFFVVGTGGGNFDGEIDTKSYNLVDPPQVNTITMPRNGWVAIRFKATNPGVWLFHCHLDRHLSLGMNFVIIVKNGGTLDTNMRGPPPNMPSCDIPSTIKLHETKDASNGAKGSIFKVDN